MKLLIEKIEVSQEFYPRQKPDDEVIARYRAAIDLLPPIDVAQVNGSILLVDGYQRILAHKLEQRTEIEANIRTDLDSADAVLMEAIRANNKHGSQLSLKDKQRLARQLFGKYTIEQIAVELSVSDQSVRNWVKDLQELEEFRQHLSAFSLYIYGKTFDDIATALNTSPQTVSGWIKNFGENCLKKPKNWNFEAVLNDADPDEMTERKQQLIEEYLGSHLLDSFQPPPSLQEGDIWIFNSVDKHYGADDYPGRIPGQIIENLLWLYTKPFSDVYDPFAGSGTTIDVCRAMFRRYWSSDIEPFDATKGIRRHDILTEKPDFFPQRTKMDLVFLDPPYGQQKQGEYSAHATNLANLPASEFIPALVTVADHCLDILKPNGILAVLLGQTLDSGVVTDHPWEFSMAMAGHAKKIDRIVVPYTSNQLAGYHITGAREGKYLLKRYRDLLIYQKEA
jgi:transposase-like protein